MNDRSEPTPPSPSPSLFTGELSDAEVHGVLEYAASDPEASRELDFVAELAATVERDPGALAEEDSLPFVWVAVLSVAAAGVLFFFVSGFVNDHGPVVPELPEMARFEPPTYAPTELRSSTPPLARAFAAAMEPYAADDPQAAAASLADFLEEYPGHGPGHFYLGAVHLAGERLEQAAPLLERASELSAGLLGDHARWLRVQVALLEDDAATARAELEPLASGEGPFGPQARELLEALAQGR